MAIPKHWQENEYWSTKSSIDCEFFQMAKIPRLIEYYQFLKEKMQTLRENKIRFPLFEGLIGDFNSFNALQKFATNIKNHINFIVENLALKSKILQTIIETQIWQIQLYTQKNSRDVYNGHSDIARDMELYRANMENDFITESMKQVFREKYETAMNYLALFPAKRFNPIYWEWKRLNLDLLSYKTLQKEVISIVKLHTT